MSTEGFKIPLNFIMRVWQKVETRGMMWESGYFSILATTARFARLRSSLWPEFGGTTQN